MVARKGAHTKSNKTPAVYEDQRRTASPMAFLADDIIAFAAIDHRIRRGRVLGIKPADLSRHVYVVGKTGVGKTALLENLALAEIRAGRGVGVIDPHGDLAERLLQLIPRSRTNDVVLFDPADAAYPVGLNLLDDAAGDRRPLVASVVLSVFRKTFSEFWGPRLEHVFRNALLAVLERRDATLLQVLRMLVEERYRERVVEKVTDPVVRHYWVEEFSRYPASFAAEVVAPVQNKLGAALSSPVLRNILGQHRSGFDARTIMDKRHILITNLAKGRIGEDASTLLGAILVAQFQLAAYARADAPVTGRTGFTLYVDEFPSFVTTAFGELLSEARKYGLALVLAHQHLGQLPEGLRRAVLGNVGTLITFRLGAEDAVELAPEFEPELSAGNLTRLGRHQIALRLSVDGMMTPPFTALTLPPDHGHGPLGVARAAIIRSTSRERYSRARSAVEQLVKLQF